jgi:nucleoside diphosphate kinase
MYILLKHPNFLGDVLAIIRDYQCAKIKAIYAPKLTREQAEIIYNNFRESPHYERAVSSLINPPHLFVITFDLDPNTSIEDFKRIVQGPYGTTDTSTVRGHIAAALENADDGYVHVPDSEEKANEDLTVFGEPMQV